MLETNLDDINAEILGNFVEKALAAGALDVFHTAIQMKKNRPGVLLTVLCAEADADKFSELLLRETSAFGVRRYTAERRKLRREFVTVQTPHGAVTVKLGRLDGKVLQAAPEFESCRKLAEQAQGAGQRDLRRRPSRPSAFAVDMIDAELLKILCCPETHQDLRPAEAAVIDKLNAQIAAGTLKNRAGQPVQEKIDGGLVRADGKFLYPIRREHPGDAGGRGDPACGAGLLARRQRTR